MIFVFFAYGGWNEMAYVSAEVRHPQKNILRALVLGTLAVAAVYIAVNLAFVHALGLAGLQQSKAVAADVLSLGIGPRAGKCISLLICITALGGINGMIFTGARILYAMGTEHRFYAWLGQWSSRTDAPARPLIIQAAVTVALTIGFGWNQQGSDGFREFGGLYLAVLLALSLPGRTFAVRLAGCIIRSAQPTVCRFIRSCRCCSAFPGLHVFQESRLCLEHTPWGLSASAAVLGIGAFLAFVESYTDRG